MVHQLVLYRIRQPVQERFNLSIRRQIIVLVLNPSNFQLTQVGWEEVQKPCKASLQRQTNSGRQEIDTPTQQFPTNEHDQTDD